MIQVNGIRMKLDRFSFSSDSKVLLSLLSNSIYFWLFCGEYLVKRQDEGVCERDGVRVRAMRRSSD
jgi:hypothetical protein